MRQVSRQEKGNIPRAQRRQETGRGDTSTPVGAMERFASLPVTLPGETGSCREQESLQESFQRFRLRQQENLKRLRRMRENARGRLRDPEERWRLRMKFLTQAKSYIGTPYSRKYQEPGTVEYESPLFLDCCGLVRKAVRDLSEDFGFVIGPGNQAYQYDTLPLTLEKHEDMKPGDLVFISGTYFSPHSNSPHTPR
ncbi:uncharacterized protein [Lepisosteus oculatus]|uniref:uncharacterized protein isoform X2 n=1 Tax=Lepisosteus oculatus TaxID=7918 RepID=UPI00371AA396